MMCDKCGGEASSAKQVDHNGLLLGLHMLCDQCWCNFLQGLRLRRVEFNTALDRGLTREAANARVIRLSEEGYFDD